MSVHRNGARALVHARSHKPWYATRLSVADLPSQVNNTVWVRGYLHAVRAKGKCAFVVLRQGIHSVQVRRCVRR